MSESRTVRFGRRPVSGPLGKVVDHWAIHVGDLARNRFEGRTLEGTWWEVAGPENDGHIRPNLESVRLSGGLPVSSDIVAEYIIKSSTEDQAASGADLSPHFDNIAFAGMFLWLFVSVVMRMFVSWISRDNSVAMLYWTLLMGSLATLFILGRFLVMEKTLQQFGLIMFPAIFDLVSLSFILTDIIVTVSAAERGAWVGLLVRFALVSLSVLCIGYGYWCWVRVFAGRCAAYTVQSRIRFHMQDIRHFKLLMRKKLYYKLYSEENIPTYLYVSILGTTRKSDQQIEAFNTEFLKRNPQYKGLTVNCQWYAQNFLDFLMQEGERSGDLPSPESPMTNPLFAVFIIIFALSIVLSDRVIT